MKYTPIINMLQIYFLVVKCEAIYVDVMETSNECKGIFTIFIYTFQWLNKLYHIVLVFLFIFFGCEDCTDVINV